jgi:hypothetical protein
LRALEAFRLRTQGWRFKQIAVQLGYGSARSAWRAWRRTLDEVTAERHYRERRRAEDGRPHEPRPGLEDAEQMWVAYQLTCAEQDCLDAERLDMAGRQQVALLAAQARGAVDLDPPRQARRGRFRRGESRTPAHPNYSGLGSFVSD